MKSKICFVAFVFLGPLLAAGGASAQYLHPNLTTKKTTVRSVVILPPKVQIVKQGVKGSESMIEESDKVSAAVGELVAEALRKKKITILAGPAAGPAGAADNDRKYQLANVQSRYDQLLPKLVKKPNDVKKGRFTLGDEVAALDVDRSADALVFIRGEGTRLTKGKQLFSLLNPISFSFPFVFITIGLVDAHTGEVLVFAKPLAVGDVIGREQKVLSKPLAKSLKKLPDAP